VFDLVDRRFERDVLNPISKWSREKSQLKQQLTACSSRHNPSFDYIIAKMQRGAMHCTQWCGGFLDKFLLNSPLKEYIL